MTFDKCVRLLLKGERIQTFTWRNLETSPGYIHLVNHELVDSHGNQYVLTKSDFENTGWDVVKY